MSLLKYRVVLHTGHVSSSLEGAESVGPEACRMEMAAPPVLDMMIDCLEFVVGESTREPQREACQQA